MQLATLRLCLVLKSFCEDNCTLALDVTKLEILYSCFSGHMEYKVSIFGVFLVGNFPHSDWIQRDTECISVFSPNVGNYEPEYLYLRVSIDDNFGVLNFAFLFLVKLTKTYFYFESPAIPVKKLIGQSKEITQKYLAVVTKPLFLEWKLGTRLCLQPILRFTSHFLDS